MGPDETLAWEARHRPRAVIAASLAALMPFLGLLVTRAVFDGRPTAPFLDALDRAAAPGPVGRQPTLQLRAAQFNEDHAFGILGIGLALALGALLTGYALWVLARMARHRRPELPAISQWLPLAGAGLLAAAYLLSRIAQVADAHTTLGGARTVDAAVEAGRGPVQSAAGIAAVPAILAVGIAFVLVCLYAMRVGLLTRFIGVLGMCVGGAFALTFGQISPFPQSFWLGALGLLFAGRWPNGQPPAWSTGRDEPWPTQQQLREERERGAAAPGPVTPAAAPASTGTAQPSSRKKKKRKRRG